MVELKADGGALLERLAKLPGGSVLLALAEERGGGVELVGGAVRDMLLGGFPRELDVVVAHDAPAFAATLAQRLDADDDDAADASCEVSSHERFGTALVRRGPAQIDLATRRAETYAAPGVLPDVVSGTPEQDLARRDFTVNAIAVAIAGAHRGELRAVAGALEDLAARRLRVLHDASFLDDPTRILRLVRYATRLRFEIEPHTAALAAAAIAGGALQTVSAQRLGAELRLAFAEPDPSAALVELDRMGVLTAWQPGVSFDEQVVRTALEIMPEEGSTSVLLAAALLLELTHDLDQEDTEPAMRGFLCDLQLPSGEGNRVFRVAVNAALVIDCVNDVEANVDLLELVESTPVESLALAGAVHDVRDGLGSEGRLTVEYWLHKRRHVVPQVTGDDLIAAGVPEGPEIGVRLQESYRLLLEERIEPGREAELRAALEARV